MSKIDPTLSASEWLAGLFDALTTEIEVLRPSEWAEQKRYLPPSSTSLPGFYSFAVTPYMREIVDCFGVESPIREVALMKGVQIAATTNLENIVGYYVDHVGNAPMMLLTADAELAKDRLEQYIIPMLQLSGLGGLITPADEINKRRTGITSRRVEWRGGGFLLPFGAQNASKLRSFPIQILLRDEVDGYPDIVGNDGCPLKLSADRTAGYESRRKILDISTPLIKGQSKIESRYLLGDQRKYHVRCLKCGFAQEIRWRRTNSETGEVTGITWETEGGRLVIDSVRYVCCECGHPHTNDDKTRLLSPNNGAEWVPTAVPSHPYFRSYHISALYSPVGMQTWAACVRKWLEAWDDEHNRSRDNGLLQVFYNNVLGVTFEQRGEKVRFESVSAHRRSAYHFGQIPNKWAQQSCGGPIAVLTCQVDVHASNLSVAVMGWCRESRCVLVQYWKFEGDTEQLDNPETWGRLRSVIETREWVADDGKVYRVALTLIDSGFRTDHVYRFCEEYSGGVYPVKGREVAVKSAQQREFSSFTTPNGLTAYSITVDFYKERWSAALRRSWDGQSVQPSWHFNAPGDVWDKQLKELTVETKHEKINKLTKKRIGFEWRRPSGAPNELWDLLVYGNAALDLIAWDYSVGTLALEFTNWAAFWDACVGEKLFFKES
jgi:phage terminase large subunit GpA-like protein